MVNWEKRRKRKGNRKGGIYFEKAYFLLLGFFVFFCVKLHQRTHDCILYLVSSFPVGFYGVFQSGKNEKNGGGCEMNLYKKKTKTRGGLNQLLRIGD